LLWFYFNLMEEKGNYSNINNKTRQKGDLFELPQTRRTPKVLFDLNKGVFKIAGTSQPYDVNNFYFPLMRKIDHYLNNPSKNTHLIFNLDDIDFSSSQFILAIIYRMKRVFASNSNLRVEWFYKEENQEMLEVGETYAELSGLDFVFRPVKKK